MTNQVDDNFYNRADAHIALANEQCQDVGKGKVSASFLYGAARFNAYIGAINSGSRENMQAEKENIVSFISKNTKKCFLSISMITLRTMKVIWPCLTRARPNNSFKPKPLRGSA